MVLPAVFIWVFGDEAAFGAFHMENHPKYYTAKQHSQEAVTFETFWAQQQSLLCSRVLLLKKLHAAAVQSVESMRGTFQQEMHSLKAERSQLRKALHDVKWAASQAAGPNQAAVSARDSHSVLPLPVLCLSLLHSVGSQ